MSATPQPFRAGIVAIIGRANTGKSSLLNAILGEQVSVVSPVAQTTRRPIRGILNEPHLQIVFLDTPGIRRASHNLSSMLNRTTRGSRHRRRHRPAPPRRRPPPQDEDLRLDEKLAAENETIFAILNKTDIGLRRAAYETAWAETIAAQHSRNPKYAPLLHWFEVSALTGAGLPICSPPSAPPCESRPYSRKTCSPTTPAHSSSPMSSARKSTTA